MNCKPGELAFVIRVIPQVRVGTVLTVNSWSHQLGRWDVEASGALFFFAHDDDLCAMRAWDIPKGFRDEAWDPVWIFGDFPDGEVDIQRLGRPKQDTYP